MPQLLLFSAFISHGFASLCVGQAAVAAAGNVLLGLGSLVVLILMSRNKGGKKNHQRKGSSKIRQRGMESSDHFCNGFVR